MTDSVIHRPNQSPLDQGKELRALRTAAAAAGEENAYFTIDAEAVAVSVWCGSISGDLSITVWTQGTEGQEAVIIEFPTLSSPTSELLIKKSAVSLQKIRIHASYTDACEFEVRVRGINAAVASTKIEGSNVFDTDQVDITISAATVIPAALDDQNGIVIGNNNVGGSEILYVSGTLAKTTAVKGWPIYPGGNLALNIAAGAAVYGVASSGTIDVRIARVGS